MIDLSKFEKIKDELADDLKDGTIYILAVGDWNDAEFACGVTDGLHDHGRSLAAAMAFDMECSILRRKPTKREMRKMFKRLKADIKRIAAGDDNSTIEVIP